MIELSPIVRENPTAVFIRRTHVTSFEDRAAFVAAGRAIAEDLFGPGPGAAAAEKIVIKPNVVWGRSRDEKGQLLPVQDGGVVTNAHFVGGVIDALRAAGASDIVITEGSTGQPEMQDQFFREREYDRVAARRAIPLIITGKETYLNGELNWTRVHGVVFRDIPTPRPGNDPGTRLLNLPTLKTHNLAITSLCVKNLQGCVAHGYKDYCAPLGHLLKRPPDILQHFQPDFVRRIEEGFRRHKAEGYPLWDKDGTRDETYCQRACDTLLALKPWINIIEGVVGRDGTAFHHGKDILANVILAGVSPVNTDAVATYLMGHNPQNVGYLKIAKERGLGENDVSKIPVFEFTARGHARRAQVSDFPRLQLGVYHYGDTSRYVFF